jgi:uncharacterized protein YprB with RNaseH-like and TPR domain
MNHLIYDIETYAPVLKDVTDYNGKYSPFPLKEQIICLSCYSIQDKEQRTFISEIESDILQNFWDYVNFHQIDTLIGFNNSTYDDQFLIVRSFVNSIKIKKFESLDLRTILSGTNIYAKGKLSEYGKALGVENKTENGSKMREYFEKKDFDTIKAHNEEDVIITLKIYQQCQECGLI